MSYPVRRMNSFTRPLYDDAAPPNTSPPAFNRRRGRVASWNTATGENVIEGADGITYENVPCLNNLDYLIIGSGDSVELLTYSGLWYVLGRITSPGTEDAARLLSSIIGISDDVPAAEDTSSSTYTDLSTLGPSVQIAVPASGQVWLKLRADIVVTCNSGVSNGSIAGLMSFVATGANTISASDSRSISLGAGYTGSPATGVFVRGVSSDELLLQGLNPGVTTFTAKYRRDTSASATGGSQFRQRVMTVRGF